MIYSVSHHQNAIDACISLPASKSLANRVLLIRALSASSFPVHRIPDSDDSRVLVRALESFSSQSLIDIGHAGTSMRFLTAFLATRHGRSFTLSGSARMKNRPIAKLVDTLRDLGADIQYLEKEGYPPLSIRGTELQGGRVTIDGGVSSQYISAILMIAPTMPKGLELVLENTVISASYIRMTLDIMRYFGVQSNWEGNCIRIAPQTYIPKEITIESDWSAASYWFQIVALSQHARVLLKGLRADSVQGDARLASLFSRLGVSCSFSDEGLLLQTNNERLGHPFSFDFVENPDLVQTFVVTLCMLDIPFVCSGTQTLKIKETDRINALSVELKKFGYLIESETPEVIAWNKKTVRPLQLPVVETYDDHRMAMCFAPVALLRNQLLIADPFVVAKSYPSFWEDLRMAGFQVEACVDR